MSRPGSQGYQQRVPNENRVSASDPLLHQHYGTPSLRPVRHDSKQRGQQHLSGIEDRSNSRNILFCFRIICCFQVQQNKDETKNNSTGTGIHRILRENLTHFENLTFGNGETRFGKIVRLQINDKRINLQLFTSHFFNILGSEPSKFKID